MEFPSSVQESVGWPASLRICRKRDCHGMEVHTLEEAQGLLKSSLVGTSSLGKTACRHIRRATTLLFRILTLLYQGWNSGTLPRCSWALRWCWRPVFILFSEFEIPFLSRSFAVQEPPLPSASQWISRHSHIREEVQLCFFPGKSLLG